MTDIYSPNRVEPTLDQQPGALSQPSVLADDPTTLETQPVAAPAPYRREEQPGRPADDQLSRIEDKTARIEEKYARSEAFLQRIGDKVEAATSRMNDIALQSDLKAVRAEVSAISRRVRGLAGLNALVATAIVTSLLTSAITVAVLKYGIPGLLPR